jgi:hypothetical protein
MVNAMSELVGTSQLPRAVEDLTPEWLSGVLSTGRGSVQITSMTVDRIIWGSATKVFANLTFEGDSKGVPERVCIKGGFDERSRAFGLGAAYELEGNFYRDLAAGFGAEVPECYYAEAEPEQGVVILEDLTLRGAEFGDATNLWSIDDVASTLAVQAAWHAPLWGSKKGDHAWLPVGCQAAREAFTVMLSPEQFHPLIEREEIPALSVGLRDDARVRAGFRALWEHDDSSVHTINHGDAHFAQLYRVPGHAPAYLDWQTACLAPWAHDVSYFMGSALSVADRRANERELLQHYVEALHAAGGPTIGQDDAWREYRLHTLHGFAWMCVPTVMQPSEVVAAMATRYAAAIEDHDPIGLLLG